MAAQAISQAESFDVVYQAFSQINFTAFDYLSIKQSLVNYIKVYFPESFNDFIESSEFVAIMEVFAYLGELLIYRVDVGSTENFITIAQRKQSVLRLAKLISYKATRNLPARGMLKITSVSTSANLYDSSGNSLQNTTVLWNDVNNSLWQDQFQTIMNAAMVSPIGTVAPNDRVQVDNLVFELYTFNNIYPANGVLPYAITSDGTSYPMEVVPLQLNENGPYESVPSNGTGFTFAYASDGFGNNSPTTGFLLYTKQGQLQSTIQSFDGKTPNQYIDLPATNINDTDVWVNNIDATTLKTLDDGTVSGQLSGQWNQVDTTTAQNVIFSYTGVGNVYETETLQNDGVRIAFGDGQFAPIPSGTFQFWYRISANQDLTIQANTVVNQGFTLQYLDELNQVQTLRFTASLISSLQNASASEDIDHIRQFAPSTYYTQNRMVNAADYNLYPLKDPTILKLTTINRTYAGESKFSYWYDPSNTYENVKMVGDDLTLTLENYQSAVTVATGITVTALFNNYIVPILSSEGMYTLLYSRYVSNIRTGFTPAEATQIQLVLSQNIWPTTIYITYNNSLDLFSATPTYDPTTVFQIDATVLRGQVTTWTVTSNLTKVIVESPTTSFWTANQNSILSYDTLTPETDQIVVLKANPNSYNTALLNSNINLSVSGVTVDATTGLQDINSLEVIAYDATNSYISGTHLISNLINPTYYAYADGVHTPTLTPTAPPAGSSPVNGPITITLPTNLTYVKGMGDIAIPSLLDSQWEEDPSVQPGQIASQIVITGSVTYPVPIIFTSFVYYNRALGATTFNVVPTTDQVRLGWAAEVLAGVAKPNTQYDRQIGASNLNFMWLHTTSMYQLVDPSPTNINDAFIIQKGYYTDLQNWLLGNGSEPAVPTALQLRNDYSYLLTNMMVSDTLIFHPGTIKLIIGKNAIPELQATIVVVSNPNTALTNSQIQTAVVNATRAFFDISLWNFGQTFYFTALSSAIHTALGTDISSVVLVPTSPGNYFGDLFQVNMSEDEIVQVDITIDDVQVVTSLNAVNMNQFMN